jgi:putative nucleotidyltransferase with HDIG domain
MESIAREERQWTSYPLAALLVRVSVRLVPIGAAATSVYVAALFVRPPEGSFWAYLGWWAALSAFGMLVLALTGRFARRFLPLATLLDLSLIFPDRTPSRFGIAMESGTVTTLEKRIAGAKRLGPRTPPADAARRLLGLVTELDRHDRLTRGHSERVRAYARLIGIELRLGTRDLERLNWAALLHDVGKLEVPHEVLTKISPLTIDEWGLIKQHPERGAAMVASLEPWLGSWINAVADHHERWNGEGYPHGLSGAEISLAGRIVAVADVFDVLTSARTYKQPSTAAEARTEIANGAGTQFDPDVVRALMAISVGRTRVSGPLTWLAEVPLFTAALPTAATLSAATLAVTTAPGVHRPNTAVVPPRAVPEAITPTGSAAQRAATRGAPARPDVARSTRPSGSSAAGRSAPATGSSTAPGPASPPPPTGTTAPPQPTVPPTPTESPGTDPSPPTPPAVSSQSEVTASVDVSDQTGVPPVSVTVPVPVPDVPVPVPAPDNSQTVTVQAGPVKVTVPGPKPPIGR